MKITKTLISGIVLCAGVLVGAAAIAAPPGTGYWTQITEYYSSASMTAQIGERGPNECLNDSFNYGQTSQYHAPRRVWCMTSTTAP
jgi:hypothetical protein